MLPALAGAGAPARRADDGRVDGAEPACFLPDVDVDGATSSDAAKVTLRLAFGVAGLTMMLLLPVKEGLVRRIDF